MAWSEQVGGVEWVVREGRQLEAGYTFHKDTGSSAVSVSNKNEHAIRSMYVILYNIYYSQVNVIGGS